jgi:hypothetical protein
MTRPRLGESYGRRAGLAGLALAALGLLLAGPAGPAASGTGDVLARLGPLTVTATALRPGPSGTLTASVQVSTSGRHSDQLDAAIAAGGGAVALYHEQVSLAEAPDLTGCGGGTVPLMVVKQWLHYGPLQVPSQSGAPAAPVDATLTVQPAATMKPAGQTLTITFYFAGGGVLSLKLPVERS